MVLLSRYRVLRKVGRGGFGAVYLVDDAVIEEQVILRILNPQLSVDDSALKRFVQELKITRRITHKNVIRIYDFLELGSSHAVSMEYFSGQDLWEILEREKSLDCRRGLRIMSQVCDGLAAAHAEGVVHRDIKPANILVGNDDEVKVLDFGLASANQNLGSRLTKSGLLIGTPEYMAPEQISDEEVDHRSDIYSAGILMYEMFSGRKPFTAETPVKILFQHLEGEAPPLSEIVPGLPQGVSDLVARSMSKAREDRSATVEELKTLIEKELETIQVSSE
jgi:serine/threonine-protein kinase